MASFTLQASICICTKECKRVPGGTDFHICNSFMISLGNESHVKTRFSFLETFSEAVAAGSLGFVFVPPSLGVSKQWR